MKCDSDFLGRDTFREKRNNQSQILVLVPRGGVNLSWPFNVLARPTFPNPPIESQWVFSRLSTKYNAARLTHMRTSV